MIHIHPKFQFHQGATPTLVFDLPPGLDPAPMTFTVTFAQRFRTVLQLTGPGPQLWLQDGRLLLHLTAADTQLLAVGDVDAQIHYENADRSVADSSCICYGRVLRRQEVTV